MQINISELNDAAVMAVDGETGRALELYFDDETWRIRYLAADTENFIPGRKRALIPLAAFAEPDRENRRFKLNISKEKVAASPGLRDEGPITFRHKADAARYYRWPVSRNINSEMPSRAERPSGSMTAVVVEEEIGDHALVGVRQILGYTVQGINGPIGVLSDLVVDDVNWDILSIVAALEGEADSSPINISPELIERISPEKAEIGVGIRKEDVITGTRYEARGGGRRVHARSEHKEVTRSKIRRR